MTLEDMNGNEMQFPIFSIEKLVISLSDKTDVVKLGNLGVG